MNNTEQKHLRLKVLEALEPFYISNGFKLQKSNGVFLKNSFEVFFGVSKKNIDAIYFNPRLTITNSEVSSVHKLLFEKNCLVTSLLAGFRLANQFGNYDYDYLNIQEIDQGTGYKAEPDSDIGRILEHHSQYMEKVGFAFFEKMSTLEGIHEFINGRVLQGSATEFSYNMKEPQIARFFTKREVLSGLITSYLLSKPETNELIYRYKLIFEGNDFVLNDVERIIKYYEK